MKIVQLKKLNCELEADKYRLIFDYDRLKAELNSKMQTFEKSIQTDVEPFLSQMNWNVLLANAEREKKILEDAYNEIKGKLKLQREENLHEYNHMTKLLYEKCNHLQNKNQQLQFNEQALNDEIEKLKRKLINFDEVVEQASFYKQKYDATKNMCQIN